jgi:hypothetical protein
MTAGPFPFGSFLMMIGLLGVPLQSWIVSGALDPAAIEIVSPGLIEEQLKFAV